MRQMTRNLLPAAATGIGLLIAAGAAWAEPSCSASAHTRRLACEFDLRDDDFTAAAQCQDWATPDPACFDDAGSEFDRAKLGVLVICLAMRFLLAIDCSRFEPRTSRRMGQHLQAIHFRIRDNRIP